MHKWDKLICEKYNVKAPHQAFELGRVYELKGVVYRYDFKAENKNKFDDDGAEKKLKPVYGVAARLTEFTPIVDGSIINKQLLPGLDLESPSAPVETVPHPKVGLKVPKSNSIPFMNGNNGNSEDDSDEEQDETLLDRPPPVQASTQQQPLVQEAPAPVERKRGRSGRK